MIERRAHPKGSSEPRKSPGLVTQLTMKRSPRGIPGPPSVSGLASRPIKSEPRGYRTGWMCVTSSGSMPDVIATPSVKSTVLLREVAPTIASLFVRTRRPSAGESAGRDPRSRARKRRSTVPRTPAARMTMGGAPLFPVAGQDRRAANAREGVTTVVFLPERVHLRFRKDLRPALLGQVEVVLVQRVLGVVAAADHASSAKHTARPRRALAAEVGVGDLLSRLAEKDGDVGSPESSALADLLRALPQDSIGLGEPWIGRGAQHPLCRDVVRCERLFPVPA